MTKPHKRVIVLLIDSLGIGESQDAKAFGDVGADTFGHIVECAQKDNLLAIPHLTRMGLAHAALASTGKRLPGLNYDVQVQGLFGYAVEQSSAKDTPSGHWEICGLPLMQAFKTFPKTMPSFPESLVSCLIARTHIPGILGNKHSSGTTILEELGETHIQTGKLIIYTSADSVLQIAAHETHFGLEKLYAVCRIARGLADPYNIGRVIARPFVGERALEFVRTDNRRDYTMPPPGKTLFDHVQEKGLDVITLGKTSDIFAGNGITKSIKGAKSMALFDKTLEALAHANDRSLLFTNFVEFDSEYGHRRDPEGYAKALTQFDKRLPEIFAQLGDDDLIIVTADHGNDPTMPGSDHTREHIPVLAFGPNIKPGSMGRRETFADIGQSIAHHLDLAPLLHGVSFLR